MVAQLYLWNCIDKGQLWLQQHAEDPANWAVTDRVGLEKMIGRELEPEELEKGREICGRDDFIWQAIQIET
jgi:hypothetical protein